MFYFIVKRPLFLKKGTGVIPLQTFNKRLLFCTQIDDNSVVFQKGNIFRTQHNAAPRRKYEAVFLREHFYRFRFNLTKIGIAFLGKKPRNVPIAFDNVFVRVRPLPSKGFRQKLADGGLSRTHHTAQNQLHRLLR